MNTRPQPGRRRAAARLAALGVGVAFGVCAAEMAARFIPERKPPRTELPFFRASKMPLNSFGYHDYEYPVKKGKKVFRILVAGDSFSAAEEVAFEDGYPKKLEFYLNSFGRDKGAIYQVINMSRGGRSTPEEVRLIMREADRLKPDLVILGHCMNDPEDWQGAGREYLNRLRKKCRYIAFEKPKGAVPSFLYDRSALCRLILRRTFNARAARGHRHYFHRLYSDRYEGWLKARQALRDLGAFSRSRRIPAMVLLFPIFSYGIGDDYPFADIEAKMRRTCEDAGLRYVDLFPLYKGMDHVRLVVDPLRDPHPSEIAHRIAAEALWDELTREGMTPDGKRQGNDPVFPVKPPIRR